MKRYGLYPELHTEADWFVFGTESGKPEEWLFTGRLAEYGQRYNVKFDVTKEKVIAIFGKRGQGKSYTLGSLIEGMVTEKSPSSISAVKRERAVLLFDTLNIFQWMNIPLASQGKRYDEIQKQAEAMAGWDISPESLAVDIWVPGGYRYRLTSSKFHDLFLNIADFTIEDWGALLGLDMVRDIKGQFLTEIYQKVVILGWTDDSSSFRRPNQNYGIQDLIECIENDEDRETGIYRSETRRAILQQLRAYQRHPIFYGDGTPLKDILKPGRIAVILLNRLPEDMRSVLVATLVRRIIQERAEASENIKDLMVNPELDEDIWRQKEESVKYAIPKACIVIDEAQNVIPFVGKTSATESLIKLVKEGRNFGLSFVVTTQQPRALDMNVLSQVETFIIHKLVSQADIDFVLDNLKCPFPLEFKDHDNTLSPRELIRDISVGQAVVSDTNSSRSFVMEIRPRISVHGGFEA